MTAVSTDDARPAAPRSGPRRRWLFAAVFVLLLVAGLIQTAALFADDAPTPALEMHGNHLIASGILGHALRQPDTAPLDRAPIVGPRTRNADGTDCRRFAGRPAEEGPITGTACLIEGEWRVIDLRQDVATPKLR